MSTPRHRAGSYSLPGRLRIALLAGMLVTSGCTTTPEPPAQPLVTIDSATTYVVARRGQFGWLTWLADSTSLLVSEATVTDRNLHDTLQLYRADGSHIREIVPPPLGVCPVTYRFSPELMPDGRIAYTQTCRYPPPGSNFPPPEKRNVLAVWDPATDQHTLLRPYFLASWMHGPAFSPDGSRVIISNGLPHSTQLYWLYHDHYELINFNVDQAQDPAWSPDGRTIAFVGRKDLSGRSGISVIGQPIQLYLYDLASGSVRHLDTSQKFNYLAKWSPDGRWLLAALGNDGKSSSLYLVDPSSGRTFLFARQPDRFPLGSFSWSPDGKRVAVATATNDSTEDRPASRLGFYVLDVPDLSSLEAELATPRR